MSELDIGLVRAFSAIYDEKSVSRAAERLSLSQSAVSGLLARLRDIFDDPLFIRSQRGVIPTPKAEALAGRMRDVISRFDDLLEAEEFDPSNASGTIRISANDYGQRVLLLPFINWLREQAPLLKIALVPFEIEQLLEKLSRGGIDLVISIPEMTPLQLPRQFLFKDSYVGVVRKGHPLSRMKVTTEDFCAFDHVVVSPMGGSFQSPTDQALSKLSFSRNVAYSVPNFHGALEILKMHSVIAVLPSKLLTSQEGNVATFPLPFGIDGFDAIAAWHPRTSNDAMHRWFHRQLAIFAKDIP